MANTYRRNDPFQRYTAREFRPYVLALGQVVLSWNELQESLAAIFCTVMNPPLDERRCFDATPFHMWYSIKSDRTQRDLLQSLTKAPEKKWSNPLAKEELDWLIQRAKSLEDARNDAVHSPLFFDKLNFYKDRSEQILPASWQNNPRAVKLFTKRNILLEFRRVRDTAILLSDFAKELDECLANAWRPLPKRPSLPKK